MTVLSRPRFIALAFLLMVSGATLVLAFKGQPMACLGAVLMGPGVLLLGLGISVGAAAAGALAAFLFAGFLLDVGWLGMGGALALMSMSVAGVLCPLSFAELGRDEERRFEAQHSPLADERDALKTKLADLRANAKDVERKGRETDALFHAGQEISKLLTLADTLDFSREVLHDILDPGDGSPPPAFLLALEEEDRSSMRIAVVDGMDLPAVDPLVQGERGGGLYRWLKAQEGLAFVRSVAADPDLKGVPLPAGLCGLLSLPLTFQDQIVGWVVVFDPAEGGLPEGDFSNLKILCAQISIGLEKAMLYDKVQRLSVTDGLTGLTVHRHFQSRLDEELKRSERYREPLSLIMADIDHFKDFNDTWGHLAGDAVLKAVAGAFKAGLGASEMAVRYGGEEFVLVLPKQDKVGALARAEALREAVKELRVASDTRFLNVTISLGVATYPDDAMTKPGLIDRADAALYQSKKNGRDRVSAAQVTQLDKTGGDGLK